MNSLSKIIFATSKQKVLSFLAEDVENEYTEKQISQKTNVKKSAVNLALKELSNSRIIEKRKIGRTALHKASLQNEIIREIKVLQNIILLYPLIQKLKKYSQKIVLFGSFADGTNKKESDIDLFVLSDNVKEVRKIANNSSVSERLQLIVKISKEMIKINKHKPLFFQEIEKGRVLFEKNE